MSTERLLLRPCVSDSCRLQGLYLKFEGFPESSRENEREEKRIHFCLKLESSTVIQDCREDPCFPLTPADDVGIRESRVQEYIVDEMNAYGCGYSGKCA